MLFDTSIFIAGFVSSHPHHKIAMKWLEKVRIEKIDLLVASHTLMECYAVLTRLPLSPKIMPGIASHLITENIVPFASIISLSSEESLALIHKLSTFGLAGGIVYNAILLKSAEKGKAQNLVTLNARDFIRLCPDNESFILVPT